MTEPPRKSDLAVLLAGIVFASLQEKATVLESLGIEAIPERDCHGMVTGRLVLVGTEGGTPRRWVVAVEDTHAASPASITCPRCGRISHHPDDIRQRYCGGCRHFHEEAP